MSPFILGFKEIPVTWIFHWYVPISPFILAQVPNFFMGNPLLTIINHPLWNVTLWSLDISVLLLCVAWNYDFHQFLLLESPLIFLALEESPYFCRSKKNVFFGRSNPFLFAGKNTGKKHETPPFFLAEKVPSLFCPGLFAAPRALRQHPTGRRPWCLWGCTTTRMARWSAANEGLNGT